MCWSTGHEHFHFVSEYGEPLLFASQFSLPSQTGCEVDLVGGSVKQTAAQILLGIHLKELGLGPIEYEFCFNPLRKWRADVAIPSQHLLFECDGGSFKGGHKRGLALGADYERQNWAQMAGYRILRFTNEQVLTGEAIKFLAEHLKP